MGVSLGLESPLFVAATAGELVTMWRIELLHPATIHFPIALTVVGTVFWLAGGLRRRWPRLGAFDIVGSVTLLLAGLGVWVAVQTGLWADGVVGRDLYDPRPLEDHENAGWTLAWLMTGTVAVDLARRRRQIPPKVRQASWLAVAVALLAANGLVIYTAHLGASLVYQQGVGVQAPPQE